ncbi:MAG: hypothetical protein Fur0032_24980 [Terrimicrobiaceae bacterium]
MTSRIRDYTPTQSFLDAFQADPLHDQILVISINLDGICYNLPNGLFQERLGPLLTIPKPIAWALLALTAIIGICLRFSRHQASGR